MDVLINIKTRNKIMAFAIINCIGLLLIATLGALSFSRMNVMLFAIVVILIVISIITGNMISNSMTRPLKTTRETLQAAAGGDLTARSNIVGKDEIGMLAYEANSTIEKMNCIISKVSINSDSVAFEAARLLDLADKMTAEAVGIATQFDSLATTSEEMSTTSGDISRNCQTAAFEALQASQTAENGVNVVENTVRVMNRIANRVKKTAKTVQSLGSCGDQIGEIIGTIEDIADQTNLLALNAAIEAARAGEQGRGFAVVADEVRALAERTTTATHEISDMIKAIQGETAEVVFAMNEGISEVERGMDEAAKSGVALRVIQEQVNSVNTHISQIATAAEEQSATTAEISRNIQHICEAMQHSAQSGNESVVATNQLSNLAEDLKMYMGQFKV